MSNIKNYYKQHFTARIVLGVVALVLIVALIVSNYFLNVYAYVLHGFFGGDNVDTSGDNVADAFSYADDVVQEAAEESMVLLKNEDNFLPQENLNQVNLFGWGSTEWGFLLTGGGSGGRNIVTGDKVPNAIKVDLPVAFEKAGIEYNPDLYEAYKAFSTYDADYRNGGSTGANPTESLKNPEASFYDSSLMENAMNYSDVAVVTISRWGNENASNSELKSVGSYSNGTFLELTSQEKAMFEALESYGFDVIVLVNVTNNIELGFLEEYSCIKACLFVGIPGQSGTMAIPKIIKGEVNPSGRMSDTLAYDYNAGYDPTYANAAKSSNDLTYAEGIYFGYKWYETADADGFWDSDFAKNKWGVEGYSDVVQFPFGYGMSYTQFSWKVTDWGIDSTLDGEATYTVKVEVTNNGDYDGKEVVQLYGHAPYTTGGIEKAERVLLGFAKTPLLKANGGHDTVEITFSAYDLASYDYSGANNNNHTGYELEKGVYEFYLMDDAHVVHEENNTKLQTSATLQQDFLYDTDPVTGAVVENRFTGTSAYNGIPIDGSSWNNNKFTHFTRSNFETSFPTTSAGTSGVANNSATGGNKPYNGFTAEQLAEVADYQYGVDAGMYLAEAADPADVEAAAKAEEGEEIEIVTWKATKDQLGGRDNSVALVINNSLLEDLYNYDDDDLWNVFLNQLTQDDIKNIIGNGYFGTVELENIGKPKATDKDGPAGFNNNVVSANDPTEYTLYPSESLLGCSWNVDVMYKVGEAQGLIGQEAGIQGWYGPGVNLHRSVYNSRNYEYFSEDGVLSGKLAAYVIMGATENNVYCYLKHFAVSEAGQNPNNLNTWLTEQALREVYLRPFEIAVKEGHANAMMSSFNNVGATLSGYNHALLTDVLRTEWGFRGSVITDWSGGYINNHTTGVLAGNNLWLGNGAAGLDFNQPGVAYAARQTVKNIIYTYVSTNITASAVKVNPAAYSSLFIALWAIIDVVLILGILACATFVALPKWPAKRVAVAAEGGKSDYDKDDEDDEEE